MQVGAMQKEYVFKKDQKKRYKKILMDSAVRDKVIGQEDELAKTLTSDSIGIEFARTRACRRKRRDTLFGGNFLFLKALFLLALVPLLASVAEASITFTTTNTAELSLYQAAEIAFSSNVLADDPKIAAGDTFYFRSTVSDAPVCSVSESDGSKNRFTVLSADTMGYYGKAIVVGRSDVFTVDESYTICYIKGSQAFEVHRGLRESRSLRVWPSIYSVSRMLPKTASGGQGPVKLTLQQVTNNGQPINAGLSRDKVILLIPCAKGDENCEDANALTQQCFDAGKGPLPAGAVQLSATDGAGTDKVTGSFTVPYVPTRYAICVPYCHEKNAGCGQGSVSMSYALVTSSPDSSNASVLTFNPANPSGYVVSPIDPQSRELGYMTITGKGLAASDEVLVISSKGSCASSLSSPSPLFPNLELGTVASIDKEKVKVSFMAPEIIQTAQTGRLCYRRSGETTWSTVYKDSKTQKPDFTISVLQPTSFTVKEKFPLLGTSTNLVFTGVGIDGEKDSAFLTSAVGTGACDNESAKTTFLCKMSGGKTPTCTVVVDPETNKKMELQVCYKKQGREKYARIAGTVTVMDRNPIVTVSPYPFHVGERARIEFIGSGLSLRDTVQIIPSDGNCESTPPDTTFKLGRGSEVVAGLQYLYYGIGGASKCLKICYRFADRGVWTAVRPKKGTQVSPDCDASFLYVSPYPLRFTLPNKGNVTAKETLKVQLSPAASIPRALKVVRSTDLCVTTPCSNDKTACEMDADPLDYVSLVRQSTISLYLGTENMWYILCALNGGNSYIPVLPQDSGNTSTTYAFRADAPNPVLLSITPEKWRIDLAGLGSVFTGTGLSSSTDRVIAFLGNALLSENPPVCPFPGSSPNAVLVSRMEKSEDTTKTTVRYTPSDGLYAGAVVHLCYEWGPSRVTYTRGVEMAAQHPSQMTTSEVPENGFRAGLPITLMFSSNASALQPITDKLYFYRFPSTASGISKCFCGSGCPEDSRVTYGDVPLVSSSTNEVLWANTRGFDNYLFSAVYTVCYAATGAGAASYMGRLNVGMGNPTHYTFSHSDSNRVGFLMTFQAVRQCTDAACKALSLSDKMRIVPETTKCNELSDDKKFEEVDAIGNATLPDRFTFTQRFTVNKEGNYRVCYKLSGNNVASTVLYQELPYTAETKKELLRIGAADPSGFRTTPAAPSAGQFLTLDLTCSASYCKSCTKVRLVPGAGASCWTEVDNTFTSDGCLSMTSVQFSNHYLTAGSFTVCYGDNVKESQRVPGTLTIQEANPSAFTASTIDLFVNQVSDVTIKVEGSGLQKTDNIFLLTEKGYSCHSLHSGAFNSNATLRNWFAPSTSPHPLTIASDGASATWIASNQAKRFGAGILNETTLCTTPGDSCDMKLCYRRAEGTWAPVPIKTKPAVRLLPSDPVSVQFEHHPLTVGLYTGVSVVGRNLAVGDVLTVHQESCSGDTLAVAVGTPTVNKEGTKWTGVLRFTKNVLSARVAVCYTRETRSITDIGSIWINGQETSIITVFSEAKFVFEKDSISNGHSLSRYEFLTLGASFGISPLSDITEMHLIVNTTECNYRSYSSLKKSLEFPVVLNLTKQTSTYFSGRLTAEPGTYALCVYIRDDGLYLVTSEQYKDASLSLTAPIPSNYVVTPEKPFPGQQFTLIFTMSEPPVEGDDVQIIDGTAFECGISNATVVLNAKVSVGAGGKANVIDISVKDDYVGKKLTVCYRRTGGTFATVPRDGVVDRNLMIMERSPKSWTASSTQVQEKQATSITFQAVESAPDFLQTHDKAFLIPLSEKHRNAVDVGDASCRLKPSVSSDELVKVGSNTMWRIPASQIVKGKYAVCYTAKANGKAVRVPPAILTIVPLQSPYGIYGYPTNPVRATSGERFYLMFNTTEKLHLVLSTTSDANKSDSVLFSKTKDCKSPLKASEVGTIPSSFGYAPLKVINEAGIETPYLHLVFRAEGAFFVCARRKGRQEGQVYFDYDVIGGMELPAVAEIAAPPITNYTTDPQYPRAWVPFTRVIPTYAPSIGVSQFKQLFFVLNKASSTKAIDVVDECHRPTKEEAEADSTRPLLDTTLQVELSTPLIASPFHESADYRLCLQLIGSGNNIVSVPGVVHVNTSSPTAYTVPEVIEVSRAFKMDFFAQDGFFSISDNLNKATIYALKNGMKSNTVPKCTEGIAPGGGVVTFTKFTVKSPTHATVEPKIIAKGYYFVCFSSKDQTVPFAVPNKEGGFVFSVGYTGAQRYVVSPKQVYMGQEMSISIFGNLLSSNDHVKLVDVTSASAGADLAKYCKAEAPNMDASESNGAAGSVVNATSRMEALYTPRVKSVGRVILCYQSKWLGNSWNYVSDIPSFTVGPPRPSTYTLLPALSYETEKSTLVITDSASTDGILNKADDIRLVKRGSGAHGFDCSEYAQSSTNIRFVNRVDAASNNSVAVYTLCGAKAASVTVCYRLVDGTWAEVPQRISDKSYVFAPLDIVANPFNSLTVSPASPRPYEPFNLTFGNSSADAEVNFVSFATYPQAVCMENAPNYVVPLHYEKYEQAPNRFTAALSKQGNYQLYLGAHTTQDPRIQYNAKFVVSACEPCGFSPTHSFLGNTVEITFPSSAKGLSLKDALRLVPVTENVNGRPCDAPTGPFAEESFKPIAGNEISTTFRISVGGNESFIGAYYMCYRRGGADGSSNYALVTNPEGSLVKFSIYPALPKNTIVCRTSPSFLETTRFQFTIDAALYPDLSFSKGDRFVLVPNSATGEEQCDEKSVQKKGSIYPVASSVNKNEATWLSTLPHGHITVSYQMCFSLAGDTIYRLIQPSPLAVAAQNPSQVITTPPVIGPEDDNFEIRISGTQLSSKDDVYVVEASERCDEVCGTTLKPKEFPSAVYDKTVLNEKLVTLQFKKPLNENVTLALCYRRSGNLLTRIAVLFVGETNPSSYKTDFVPRLGTRPKVTFFGTALNAGDLAMIVEEGTYCDASLAVATAQFTAVAADRTWSAFYLPLIGNVREKNYSVCYMRAGTQGYAQMTTPLGVLPGGPSFFKTSNTPMQGRATIITFENDTAYVSRAGDKAFVACPECSCFDGPTTAIAKPPYGNPSAEAKVNAEVLKIRVGMNNTASYPVCYLVVDSGYAEIGGGHSRLRPIANAPLGVTVLPKPTFQGQRLTMLASGFGKVVTPDSGDEAMLVTEKRLCWDTPAITSGEILVKATNVKSVDTTEGTSTWRAHVPSVGPNAPPESSFPQSYLYCYREKGQTEFVHVPFPPNAFDMLAAKPAKFVSSPLSISSGMIDARLTFPNPADGDKAYIVKYNGGNVLPDGPCDDEKSTVVAGPKSAFPFYRFSLPSGLTTGTSLVVCYTRAKETVAEVPQPLTLTKPNPSGYTTNIASETPGRLRQYIAFTFVGEGLNPETDAVAFTDKDCVSSAVSALENSTISSSQFVRRVGDLHATPGTASGKSVTVTAQFVKDTTKPLKAHVCYFRGVKKSDVKSDGKWIELGEPFLLDVPAPSSLTLKPGIGSVRAGQHVQITLTGNDKYVVRNASVISATDRVPGSWCHNFTDTDVREPLLKITSNALLDIPIWQKSGGARVCVQNSGKDVMPWADVAPTRIGSAAEVIVLEANPSALKTFPIVPRVGQQVTLTFTLVAAANARDVVRIASLTNDACDVSKSISIFPDKIPVTLIDNVTTHVTLLDNTDALRYRSFNTAGGFKVCYYSATESAWAVVGGSLAEGTLRVMSLAPSTWTLKSGKLIFAQPFTLSIDDPLGNLNAKAGDMLWAVPKQQSCGIKLEKCQRCIKFTLDTKLSTERSVVTVETASFIVGEFNLCYCLAGATAAMLPKTLSVATSPVECVQNESLRVGQEQKVTFRKRDGVDVNKDSWRVSFFGTPAATCADGYVKDFVNGRARYLSSTSTTVAFAVEWPVSMVASRYLLCYTHNGVAQPMCTCSQIDGQTGECFIETLAASPKEFRTVHTPTYVGQTIKLRFILAENMVNHPVTAVKFVSYVDGLSSCRSAAAFDTPDGKVTKESKTSYFFAFRHDYKKKSSRLIVCVLCPSLSKDYARVGTVIPSKSDHLLVVRPYLSLTTLPSKAELIRAKETIQLTFTHESKEEDDITNEGDRVTFVEDPKSCVDSTIDATPGDKVLNLFMLHDTSFSKIPAPVILPKGKMTQSSHVLVTFDPVEGLDGRYVCYKLADGTWAPVLPALNVLEEGVSTCVTINSGISHNDDVLLRAMQYVRTILVGTDETADQRELGDGVRVVPHDSSCMDDSAVVLSTDVFITQSMRPNASVVAFAPKAGTFKVCYRMGGPSSKTALWSPVCPEISFVSASPTGSFTGCLRVGQTLRVTTKHLSGFKFTTSDRMRFVPGDDQCLYAYGIKKTVAETITVGDKNQEISGTPVTSSTANWEIPHTLLGSGTNSFRLCYEDATGNQFAVPILPSQPVQSKFSVQASNPAKLQLGRRALAGQRVQVKFMAGTAAGAAALVPYRLNPPNPYAPGPAYNGNFDAVTAIKLEKSVAYREGRCYPAGVSTFGVYGNANETIGSFDPTDGGTHVACYQPAGCSVQDVGSPFVVGGHNPSSVEFMPKVPRRGQLLFVRYARNTADSDASSLAPDKDRAAVEVNLVSCWTLDEKGGSPVGGTSDITTLRDIIYHAEPPSAIKTSHLRVCYKLLDEPWSEVPGNSIELLPANPKLYSTLTGTPRQGQLNYLQFEGSTLGEGDKVKIIALAQSCRDESVPPKEIEAYMAKTGTTIPGSATGWDVTNTSSAGTTSFINIVSSITGEFSVCYRLSKDTVWTLVYSSFTIHPRIPTKVSITPASALEGELFTLEFEGLENQSSDEVGLSANDMAVLYHGEVSCLNPGSTEVIRASPSRQDNLPLKLSYQMAASRRGQHTLCYWRRKSESSTHSVVWGFPPVKVMGNPLGYVIFPLANAPLRVNQLVSAVFNGFGLVSDNDRKDEVKFIHSSKPQTNNACQTEENAASIYKYALTANGTYAVQVFHAKAEQGTFWVCYKLNGGRFHSMPGNAVGFAAADPSGAVPSSKGTKIWNGEMLEWTISTTNGASEGDYIFYSTERCNDFPYYDIPDGSTAVSSFASGAALVQGISKKAPFALLRAGSAIPSAPYSLCYRGENNTITLLKEEGVTVEAGVPPVRSTPIEVIALQIFTFTLDVAPTKDDYVALVLDPDNCVGETSPLKSDEVFIDLKGEKNKPDGGSQAKVTAAVGKAGKFYICYSHRVGRCAPGNSGECARIVGTVVAAQPQPSGWSMLPSTLYTTELMKAEFRNPPSAGAVAWLAPIPLSGATMKDVGIACLQPLTAAGRIVLEPAANGKGDKYTARLNKTGAYGVCYTPTNAKNPAIFPPISTAGPVVQMSNVTATSFASPPAVGTMSVALLSGRGLSQSDKLVAVALPGENFGTPPADMCTNNDYTPRVVADPSTAGYGLASIPRTLRLTVAGRYVLCYKAASSKGSMVLITPTPFSVTQLQLSVSLVSPALVNTPLYLEFIGSDISLMDQAALIKVTEARIEESKVCPTGKYTMMISVQSDGMQSIFTATPTESGTHVVCYRKQGSTKSLLLDARISVGMRAAVNAVFKQQPVCTAKVFCRTQPTIELVNAKGEPTPDSMAAVRMHLLLSNGTTADQYLSGGAVYQQKDYTTFNFLTLGVSKVGRYRMLARFNLIGGITIQTRSAEFEVTAGEPPRAIVSCTPVDIIERSLMSNGGSNSEANITCLITTKTTTAAGSYDVVLNVGTHTKPTYAGEDPNGMKIYKFTVVPPHNDLKAQFVSITVTPNPSSTWHVSNSPVIVRIGSIPSRGSALSCTSGSKNLPFPILVRSLDRLLCHAQGKRYANGVLENIVSMPKYMRVLRQVDGNTGGTTEIDIGSYPENVNGGYVFFVEVPKGSRAISVLGSVPESEASTAYVPMDGSPSRFVVLGVPSESTSTLVCISSSTRSKRWFLPYESFTCTVSLLDSAGPVNGIPQDYKARALPRGSAHVLHNKKWDSKLTINGTAPPVTGTQMLIYQVDTSGANLAEMQKGVSAEDWDFKVQVTCEPRQRIVASSVGVIVHLYSLKTTEKDGELRIALAGSGLSLSHKYGVRSDSNCTAGVEQEAVQLSWSVENNLSLTIPSANAAFHLCFATDEAPTVWAPLTSKAVDVVIPNNAAGVGTWVILVISCILLLALLLLCAVILWRLLKTSGDKSTQFVGDAVYMPPRVNDRFVHPGELNPFGLDSPSSTQQPPNRSLPPLQNDDPRLHLSETGDGAGGLPATWSTNQAQPWQCRQEPEPLGGSPSQNRRGIRRSSRSPSVQSGMYSDPEEMSSTEVDAQHEHQSPPRVPPALLPSYVRPLSAGATGKPETHADAPASLSGGPYQHLHHTPLGLQQDAAAQSPPTSLRTGDGGEQQTWVGPFTVKGHTSQPLVGRQ